jgi:hypothetical protein
MKIKLIDMNKIGYDWFHIIPGMAFSKSINSLIIYWFDLAIYISFNNI